MEVKWKRRDILKAGVAKLTRGSRAVDAAPTAKRMKLGQKNRTIDRTRPHRDRIVLVVMLHNWVTCPEFP